MHIEANFLRFCLRSKSRRRSVQGFRSFEPNRNCIIDRCSSSYSAQTSPLCDPIHMKNGRSSAQTKPRIRGKRDPNFWCRSRQKRSETKDSNPGLIMTAKSANYWNLTDLSSSVLVCCRPDNSPFSLSTLIDTSNIVERKRPLNFKPLL